jgi:hypothetical protein
MKRKLFLETFFRALGAKEVLWTAIEPDKICGTVLYEPNDSEEKQDFVWHMTESTVPGENVKMLLQFLSDNNLIDNDKIRKPINDLSIDFLDKGRSEKVWNELFNIEVSMLDNGEETDKYFIHL